MKENKVSKFIGLSAIMFNYTKDVPISSDGLPSWEFIMPIVDKIEELDLSDYFYSWEMDGVKRNNFMNIEFVMDRSGCAYDEYNVDVIIHLQLDPPMPVNQDGIWKAYASRKMAFIAAITGFLEYYYKLKKYDKGAEA